MNEFHVSVDVLTLSYLDRSVVLDTKSDAKNQTFPAVKIWLVLENILAFYSQYTHSGLLPSLFTTVI